MAKSRTIQRSPLLNKGYNRANRLVELLLLVLVSLFTALCLIAIFISEISFVDGVEKNTVALKSDDTIIQIDSYSTDNGTQIKAGGSTIKPTTENDLQIVYARTEGVLYYSPSANTVIRDVESDGLWFYISESKLLFVLGFLLILDVILYFLKDSSRPYFSNAGFRWGVVIATAILLVEFVTVWSYCNSGGTVLIGS